MFHASNHIYEFGEYRLNAAKRLLHRNGASLSITPKVFDTLLILIEAQGSVVTRKDLINRLWPDTFVEDANVTYNVSVLRKLLGEGPNEHKYIATVPGRGYLFVAEVKDIRIGGDQDRPPNESGSSLETVVRSADRIIDSLAVLPFVSGGASPNNAYLANGITEGIITRLSRLSQVRVLSRNSVDKYRGFDIDARSAGTELGVQAVLVGCVNQFEDRLIVRSELIDVSDGRQLWGARLEPYSTDVFQIEEDASAKIAEGLKPVFLDRSNNNALSRKLRRHFGRTIQFIPSSGRRAMPRVNVATLLQEDQDNVQADPKPSKKSSFS